MQLLLLEDVRKLGHVGDVVEVASGYARNYLLPQRLAAEPTEENMKAIEERRKVAAAERAKKLKVFTDLAEKMQDVSVTIEAAANPEGTLYGAVHERDIADALHAQGFPVRAEHVVLDAAIRTLDNRVVTLEFTDEISAEIKVWVVREGGALDDDQTGESDKTNTRADDFDQADDE
ncbi:MAG: 50S ribosomal protein L9 [Phycisphaerae bacterium]|nr:50S ribosomal protein L9 [Phycisphaerae bacterium]